MKALTSKEKLFCAYFCVNRNGRESAAKSGYRFPERSAARLLKREEIKMQIAKTDEERKNCGNDITAGYYRLAFGCVTDAVSLLFEDEVTKPLIEQMDLFNISEIKRQKNGTVEIKFFDRLKALEKLEQLSSFDELSRPSSLYSAIEKGAAALRCDDE
ncbi:MAG: terminase small subunit [Faecalibacterium sp.]|nr:terminase small subunit [Ruminococcus sp.]MCM1392678.1 terminase small subunit [Ruminococcus sp.]MCM1486346.1 terminase small subunit [Faecalibacterium sp.]